MKLMTRMTKWAVTIHGSGDSQGWAGFYASQALTQSAARETELEKKREEFFQGEVGRKQRGERHQMVEGTRTVKGWRERGE